MSNDVKISRSIERSKNFEWVSYKTTLSTCYHCLQKLKRKTGCIYKYELQM